MICSVLPLGALVSAAAASRISLSLSLDDSPAAQRLLQRVIDAGIGLFARHVPLANSKKSLQGSALRSRSATSIPCWVLACANATEEHNENTRNANNEIRNTRMNFSP